MTNQHPITPPPELVHQWHREACRDPYNGGAFFESKTLKHIATQATRWGADQELKACCEWLERGPYGFSAAANCVTDQLRDFRRPKPPSLKQQALEILADCPSGMTINFSMDPEDARSSAAHWSNSITNTPNPQPLWQVLFNAGNPPCPVGEMLAAEILAFCDWLLPAEGSPDLPHRDDPIAWKLWQERQRLRSILIEEASKAQKQEV